MYIILHAEAARLFLTTVLVLYIVVVGVVGGVVVVGTGFGTGAALGLFGGLPTPLLPGAGGTFGTG